MNSVLAAMALLAATALSSQDAATLRPTPKVGDVVTQQFSLSLEAKGEKSAVEALLEQRVSKVQPNGEYLVRSRSKGGFVKTAQGEFSDDRANERISRYAPDGVLLAIESGLKDAASYRQAFLTRFVSPPAPVKPGDTWRHERKAGRPKGVPAVAIAYRFESLEGPDAKVSFRFEETSGVVRQTATGVWWIRIATGIPTKLECDVTNYLGEAAAKATVKLQSVEPKS